MPAGGLKVTECMAEERSEKEEILAQLGQYDASELRQASALIKAGREFDRGFRLAIDDLDGLARTAASELGYDLDQDTIDERILKEVAERYNRDIRRMMLLSLPEGPDEFKQAGYLTFWFRKLKPLIPPRDTDNWMRINEVIAFAIGMCMIKSVHPQDMRGWGRTQDQKTQAFELFAHDFTYHLRYGPASPAMLAHVYYAAWCLHRVRG